MSNGGKLMGEDFATKKRVNLNAPEEKVRQDYELSLHKELNYPLEHMDIEVPIPMGSSSKECDIAVFDSPRDQGGKKIIGIIETKKSSGSDFERGRGQVESYMSATASCEWGVWTNGDILHCAWVINKGNSRQIKWDPSYFVPRFGGKPTIESYEDLVSAANLKRVFRQINYRIYVTSSIARSEKQGAEMVRLIFCKLADEHNAREKGEVPQFQIMEGESHKDTRKRIEVLWQSTRDGVHGRSIFKSTEALELDDYSICLIVSTMQIYSLLKTNRDAVGDAFEVFAEPQFAGGKGQFFTPRNVVDMVIAMINPQANERIIDPACGSGGFLISVFNHLTQDVQDERIKGEIAEQSLFGMDKEADLAKICKAQMSILGDGKSNISTGDSLDMDSWGDSAKGKLQNDDGSPIEFDIVVTNPPFGNTIKVENPRILELYDLAHDWSYKRNKDSNGEGEWVMSSTTFRKTPPQVLFIERCLKLLKPGGRMGIVLPDGLLGNQSCGYIRHWVSQQADVLAVIDCPTETFMPHTSTKTSVLLLRKRKGKSSESSATPFMAVAEMCGHTSRGSEIRDDNGKMREDFTAINKAYSNPPKRSHLGFFPPSLIGGILVPRYYDPRIIDDIAAFTQSGVGMKSLRDLSDSGSILINTTSSSARSEEYDLHGNVRFIRTSDINSSYEIYESTQKKLSEETYLKYEKRQDLSEFDILFVKDGDDKIGKTAILIGDDCHISVQSHFFKLRAKKGKMDPFLLLWLLNTPIVQRQIRQRVFSQSTLSTIGNRIYDLLLPFPSEAERLIIAKRMRELVTERRNIMREMRDLTQMSEVKKGRRKIS